MARILQREREQEEATRQNRWKVGDVLSFETNAFRVRETLGPSTPTIVPFRYPQTSTFPTRNVRLFLSKMRFLSHSNTQLSSRDWFRDWSMVIKRQYLLSRPVALDGKSMDEGWRNETLCPNVFDGRVMRPAAPDLVVDHRWLSEWPIKSCKTATGEIQRAKSIFTTMREVQSSIYLL